MSPEDRAALAKVPGHMAGELRQIWDRGLTVMQLRDFVAGEYDPLPVADLVDYLRVMEKNGMIRLTERQTGRP